MRYLFVFCFLFFATNISVAQVENGDNKLVRSFLEGLPRSLKVNNLEDLRNSKDTLSIRIWRQHEIINLNAENANYKICINGETMQCSVFDIPKSTAKQLLDSLAILNLFKLKNDSYSAIDGTYVTFEVLHNGKYEVFKYWSPNATRNESNRIVINILNAVNQKLKTRELTDHFFKGLKPGEYFWGMSRIYIDRFLGSDITKTDFYLDAKKRIKAELNVDENSSVIGFPLVLINGSVAQMADLNKYSKNNVTELEVLKPIGGITAIYGSRAQNGVIIVKTKK